MYMLRGESAQQLLFGKVVRSKVIRALAVALLPRLFPDHSTSYVWKTSAFAGGKRDDPLKKAITTPMAQTSFDFMTVTPLDGNAASVTSHRKLFGRASASKSGPTKS
jgi:hypothetical protein